MSDDDNFIGYLVTRYGYVYHELRTPRSTWCGHRYGLFDARFKEYRMDDLDLCGNCIEYHAAALTKTNKYRGLGMNNARLASIVMGLSGVARKVYDVVPITETWTIDQIHDELKRNGSRVDFSVISGCLNQIVKSKAITEEGRGHFKKITVKENIEDQPDSIPKPTEKNMQIVDNKKSEPNEVRSPIQLLAVVELEARAVMEMSRRLADGLAAAAISIEDQLREAEQKSEKLNQLQKLLKSLG